MIQRRRAHRAPVVFGAMLYHFEATKEPTKLKVDFIKADLDIALSFAHIAGQAGEHQNVIRHQGNARKGYDAGLRFITAANVTQFDQQIIRCKLL